tara:strand:- start:414 stop:887 length:474 start_codon:yes stop_codon:yes gene_type:complete
MKDKPIEKNIEKKVIDDDEEMPAYQEMVLFYLSTGVKTILIAWCITIISLAYIKLPDSKWWVADQRIDATYAAGVLGGLLGSLGVTVANSGKKKDDKNGNASAKKEIEELKAALAEVSSNQQYQTIRIETPVKIVPTGESRVDPITNRPIGPDGKLQ